MLCVVKGQSRKKKKRKEKEHSGAGLTRSDLEFGWYGSRHCPHSKFTIKSLMHVMVAMATEKCVET